MANPEYLRGAGVGWQTTHGTPAATLAWCPYFTALNLDYDPRSDTPEFLDYSLWRENQTSVATYNGRVRGTMRVDPYWLGWLFISMAGTPTGAGPYVFTGGSLNAGELTFAKVNPQISGTYEHVWDAVITQIAIRIDAATGVIEATFEGVGKYAADVASPPTPTYSTSAPILQPYMAVYSKGGSALGIDSGTFTFEKVANPRYTTPVVAPTSTTPEGLQPEEYNVMKAAGGYDLLLKYTAYTGSLFKDLMLGTEATQSISIFNPKFTGTPGLLFEWPRTKGNSGELNDEEARPRQHIVGRWLKDATAGTGVTVTATPGAGNTYASS